MSGFRKPELWTQRGSPVLILGFELAGPPEMPRFVVYSSETWVSSGTVLDDAWFRVAWPEAFDKVRGVTG